MAGHSHWAGIKHKKALIDNKRGKVWSKIAKALMVAAKLGGSDPATNARLRVPLADARAARMPKENIERAIQSVGEADEIVVVDGGSRDATISTARACGCRVIPSERGRGNQLRSGTAASSGDLLLFLHADNWLGEGAVGQLIEHAQQQSGRPIFGCFRQNIDDTRFRFRIVESGNALRAGRLWMPYGDQAMFVDRRSYERVGGFAEVPLMEDVMLSRRLRKIHPPTLLPGPVHLSARRWQSQGVIRQTVRNWLIFAAFSLGVSPMRLASWYR